MLAFTVVRLCFNTIKKRLWNINQHTEVDTPKKNNNSRRLKVIIISLFFLIKIFSTFLCISVLFVVSTGSAAANYRLLQIIQRQFLSFSLRDCFKTVFREWTFSSSANGVWWSAKWLAITGKIKLLTFISTAPVVCYLIMQKRLSNAYLWIALMKLSLTSHGWLLYCCCCCCCCQSSWLQLHHQMMMKHESIDCYWSRELITPDTWLVSSSLAIPSWEWKFC